MFSITIMASSMSIPTERERASMDILLKVKSNIFMMVKVETIDVGMARALIIVVLTFLRNRNTANTANSPPYIR